MRVVQILNNDGALLIQAQDDLLDCRVAIALRSAFRWIQVEEVKYHVTSVPVAARFSILDSSRPVTATFECFYHGGIQVVELLRSK